MSEEDSKRKPFLFSSPAREKTILSSASSRLSRNILYTSDIVQTNMDYKRFSKKELTDILDVIQAASVCETEADMVKIIHKARELVCADYCICGIERINGDSLPPVLQIVNGNYPEEWLNIYLAEKFYKIDPVIKHHLRFGMTQVWSDTFKYYNDKVSKDFLNHAADFGLKHGISGGVFEPEEKNISIFSFASNTNGFKPRSKELLDRLIPHLHKSLARSRKMAGLAVNQHVLLKNR